MFLHNTEIIKNSIHEELCRVLRSIGGEDLINRTYYVGGMVRDYFLNRKSNDIDIVVECVKRSDIFGFDQHFKYVGNDFPVYKFVLDIDGEEHDIDLAVARIERSTGKSHREFEVVYGEQVTIRDDLARRDITFNSMAVPLRDRGIVYDPFQGHADLSEGLIRHTTGAFAEDPLRVFRVARFASRFNFRVHKSTIALMNRLEEDTLTLPEDRIYIELVKLFSSAKKPSIFFRVLRESDNLKKWFPVLHHMIGLIQLNNDVDVFDHTMEVIDVAKDFGADVNTLIGALYHDVGKILTDDNCLPRHYGHDMLGLELVNGIAERLRLTNDAKQHVRDCIHYHLLVGKVDEMRPATILKMVEALTKAGTLEAVLLLVKADRHAKDLKPLSLTTFEKIRVAQNVNKITVPKDLVQRFKGLKGENIARLVEEFRICQFKQFIA